MSKLDSLLYDLAEAAAVSSGDDASMPAYGTHFENDTFRMSPYDWRDPNCGCPDDDGVFTHDSGCEYGNPNFEYKKTGFRVDWYKYIGRGMEAINEPDSHVELLRVFLDCHTSLDPNKPIRGKRVRTSDRSYEIHN